MEYTTLHLKLNDGTVLKVSLPEYVANMWEMDKETTKALA